ncbi:MAG: pantoate--beta-alanine ligase [Gammaproteobacteria bacterium]|nr:pantoate--beta-alanine ligase [Gammaproteobacteria bacterium]
MNIFTDIQSLRQHILNWKQQGESIAFVPTMGNLHAGHLQLIEHGKHIADRVVVSIFVNPMQFNEANDFKNYPRTFDDDRAKLEAIAVDCIFAPLEKDLYPVNQQLTTKVSVPVLGEILEGESRPGHFTGVTTVVCKLFNIVQPDYACFGEKDFQQLMLIRHMVAELNMPVQIEAVATCREADGLAMSSRNNRLNQSQRAIAPEIYQVLSSICEQIKQGNKDFSQLEHEAVATLNNSGFVADYVAIRSVADLGNPAADEVELVVLAAACLGDIRLIDNMPLSLKA